ncbi:hypothetical protein AcV5_009820 [Taiwanofungus camphoratus]|nr:hypothetical protein AcV5_009820 [Antrodia cinnamomea]
MENMESGRTQAPSWELLQVRHTTGSPFHYVLHCLPSLTHGLQKITDGFHASQPDMKATNCEYLDIIKPIAFAVISDVGLYNELLASGFFTGVMPFGNTAAYGVWLGRKGQDSQALRNILEVFLWIDGLRGLLSFDPTL